MKALVHDPSKSEKLPSNLIVQKDYPLPILKKDEVLVKVLASSVNRLDVMQAKGTYPIPPGVT